MENSTVKQEAHTAVIRSEFDKILMRHISGLIDTHGDIAALPFNLATIASLLLLVERENEIRAFPESPPERYNRDSFFTDIEEVGIDLDEEVLVTIQNLDQYGFVVVDAKEQYTIRESAFLLISLLDAIFPKMPGMNLVAYVSQSIEEVTSGRKEKDRALEQFDQTLDKQGVRLSTIPEDRVPGASASRSAVVQKPDPAVLQERKAAYLQKMKALREKSLKAGADPAIVGTHSDLQNVEIKELFPKEAPAEPSTGLEEDELPEGIEEEPLDSYDDTPEPLTTSEPPPYESIAQPDAQAPDAETPVMETTPAPSEDVSGEQVAGELDAVDDLDAGLTKEELVEQKIRAFEEELAMPCPICNTGKVLSDTTEKGKKYYHCSREDCRLISWGKPFHMECPLCKNPFLIEVPDAEGKIGLKCPRATCLYRKKDADQVLSGEPERTGKKKVAVVKRRRKKGARRVVRRKS